jgi:hypothetical protein
MRRIPSKADEGQLPRTRRVAGTSGVRGSIDRPLDEALSAELRRRLADRIRSGHGIDRSAEILEASRRSQS